jgi:nicotinamide mononucleotide transporter
MLETIWQYVIESKLEVINFILSVAGVWLTAKEKIINWPIGIAASLLSIYIFYTSSLFGDASLNVFYVIIGFYGWYEWMHGGDKKEALKISKSGKRTLFLLLIITIPSCAFLGKVLSYTNSNVPYWDGITTALSLAATWMMARKLIENWLVWIFTDLLYVGLYLIKHLYLFSLLYFIFTALAVYGYYQWKKQLKENSFALPL